MAEHGKFFWNQLVTTDQKICGDFYCGLLGWKRREVDAGPFGPYTIFSCGGADVGGMMNPTSDYSRSRPSWWQAFIAVAMLMLAPLTSASSAAPSLNRRMMFQALAGRAWSLTRRVL